MLISPIAQEDSSVRRTPWVSFALIGACIAVFIALLPVSGEERVRTRLGAFFEFLAQHPYLSPPPEIANRTGPRFAAALEELRGKWQAEGGQVDPEVAATEQLRLNELGEEALEAIRARPAERLGYVPAEPHAWTVLTHMFVHGDWLHLLGNMLFLFLSAPFVEDRYGRPLFAALYLLSGAAGLAGHAAHDPRSFAPLIGASGAIAGVMGAFLVRLGASRIRFVVIPIILIPVLRTHVVLPAFVVIPLWLLEQAWYAGTAPEAGVAWWAHIGGFAFGFAAALVVKLLRVEETVIDPGIEGQIGLTQNPALEAAMEARLKGDFESARREIRKVLAAEPDNVDAWTESYETALESRAAAEVGRAGERLLAIYSRKGEAELAAEIARDPRWREMDDLPPRFRMALAAWLEKDGDARSALGHYEAIARLFPQDPATLRALVRTAEILRKGGDARGARDAYTRARAHPACSDPWPGLIEKGLASLEGARPGRG
jgi:membrane associated rhomboid family serine protease